MRALLLVLLAAVTITAQAGQRPHGPYADREGWHCHQGETVERAKRVHCACKMPCDNDGMEDRTCQTYCTSPKCLCHVDESCDRLAVRVRF